MADSAFIRTQDVRYSYSGDGSAKIEVLRGISLEIGRGSFVALLGHNGSGKSTFAKLLNSVLIPDSGHIYIDGVDITDENLDDDSVFEIRRRIGMVFQNPDNQLVSNVVEEDIAFGPENLGIPAAQIRERVNSAMELLGISEYARHSPSRLSGGQKQRVAIAGVVAMMPECIIFDEATAMLDPGGRAEVREMMKRLNREKGITVISITHNMEEAVDADRVIVMNDGAIAMDGTPREVFSQVGRLNALGLDVPQVSSVVYDYNADDKRPGLPEGMLDVGECADAIVGYFEKIKEKKHRT